MKWPGVTHAYWKYLLRHFTQMAAGRSSICRTLAPNKGQNLWLFVWDWIVQDLKRKRGTGVLIKVIVTHGAEAVSLSAVLCWKMVKLEGWKLHPQPPAPTGQVLFVLQLLIKIPQKVWKPRFTRNQQLRKKEHVWLPLKQQHTNKQHDRYQLAGASSKKRSARAVSSSQLASLHHPNVHFPSVYQF